VRSWVSANYSVSQAANRLDVHPNSAKYRVKRIRELIGGDPFRGDFRVQIEFHDGVDCVSAPVTQDGVVVACYTVSTPPERWATEHDRIINGVQRAAEKGSNLRIIE
jgi:DNA-binding IclR family transcriptional regulator